MKILYGLQATGNGHIKRGLEVLAYLQQYASVDLLISGTESQVSIDYPIAYKKYGLSFTSNSTGGVDFLASFKKLRLKMLVHDIVSFPIQQYDFIISDCEPITAWSSYFYKKFCVGLSNQASFFSPYAPRPQKKNYISECILKYAIPYSYRIGFHYVSYDTFIETPIIPQKLRMSLITDKGHITVYLPAYDHVLLTKLFTAITDINWHIFAKNIYVQYQEKNVLVRPIGPEYDESVLSAHGIICASGFQATAEALFLGKKLLTIPHKYQYEQESNAQALKQLGVTVVKKIDDKFLAIVEQWLYNAPIIHIQYPNNTKKIVENIIQEFDKYIKKINEK